MANSKLELSVEVDSTGGIRSLQLVQDNLRRVGDAAKTAGEQSAQSFSKFAEHVKNGAENPLAAAGNAAQGFAASLGPVGVAAAAAGAAIIGLGAAGLAAASSLGHLGDQIKDTGIRMGLSTREVQAFDFAMKRAGAEGVGALEPAMKKLSQGLTDSSAEGQKARKALADIGVQSRDLHGNLRPMSDIFVQISDRLNGVGDTATRNTKAIAILGKAGLSVLPDLLQLSDGVKRFGELKGGLTDADLARFDKYLKQVTEIDRAWDLLKIRLKEPIAATVLVALKFLKDGQGRSDAIDQALLEGGRAGADALSGDASAQRKFSITAQTDRALNRSMITSAGLAQFDSSTASAASGLDRFLNNNNNLENAQRQLTKLKEKYDEARNAAEGIAKSGFVLKEDAAQHRAEVEKTRIAYERQNELVKALGKEEAKRVELLERARDLNRNRQGFYQIGTGQTASIVTQQEIEDANRNRKPPSLFGRRGNPSLADQLNQPEFTLPEGIDRTGIFVAPTVSRVDLGGGNSDAARARAEGVESLRQQSIQIRLAGLNAETSLTEHLLQLRAGENGEIATAKRIAGIRQTAIREELVATGDVVRFREASISNEIDLRRKIANEIERQQNSIKSTASGLFQTLFTRPSQFGSTLGTTLKDAALQPISNNLGRLTGDILQPTIFGADGAGGIAGTIRSFFGVGKSSDPTVALKDSTLENTRATNQNTAALVSFASGVSAGGATGVSGVPGVPSSISAPLSTAAKYSLLPLLPAGAAGAFSNFSTGLSIPNLRAFAPGDYSISTGAGTATTLSSLGASGRLGAQVGTAGVVAGAAFGVYDGLKQGGARGGLQAAASGLGAAALLDPEPISKAVLGILAVASGVIGGILGDPKQKRGEAINRNVGRGRFYDPVTLNEVQDSYGNFSDYDRTGNVRTSNLSPRPSVENPFYEYRYGLLVPGRTVSDFGGQSATNVNLTVNAIDSKSIVDRHQDIVDAVMKGLNHGGRTDLTERLRADL